jgi:hypothetical protein
LFIPNAFPGIALGATDQSLAIPVNLDEQRAASVANLIHHVTYDLGTQGPGTTTIFDFR